MPDEETDLCSQIKALKEQLEYHKKQLEYHKENDVLTQIYNKSTFYRKTAELLQKRVNYIIICIDIEKFSFINALYGNKIGDEILHYLAGHLKNSLEGEAVIGRISGDIFAVCLEERQQKIFLRFLLKHPCR